MPKLPEFVALGALVAGAVGIINDFLDALEWPSVRNWNCTQKSSAFSAQALEGPMRMRSVSCNSFGKRWKKWTPQSMCPGCW